MTKMLSRLDVARQLGRRVSRGEFERIFSKLVRVSLPNVKLRWVLQDGKHVQLPFKTYRMERHPDSPKARRKARE